MVAKDRVRNLHTFRPGPFGWCCYDCNEGEISLLLSRSPMRSDPDGPAMPSQCDAANVSFPGHTRMFVPAVMPSPRLATPRDSLPMAG